MYSRARSRLEEIASNSYVSHAKTAAHAFCETAGGICCIGYATLNAYHRKFDDAMFLYTFGSVFALKGVYRAVDALQTHANSPNTSVQVPTSRDELLSDATANMQDNETNHDKKITEETS